MSKKSTALALVPILLLVFSGACRKRHDATAVEKLTGTWKKTKVYADANNNRILDADELQPHDTTFDHQRLKFNQDGSYDYAISDTVLHGHWQLLQGNKFLDIEDTGTAPHPSYKYIESLTTTGMVLRDTVDAAYGGTRWSFYAKQ